MLVVGDVVRLFAQRMGLAQMRRAIRLSSRSSAIMSRG